MIFDLFDRAILQRDFPEAGLKRGDVGIVVERIIREGDEDGYILEFFDAQGNTVDVFPVLASALEQPRPNTILTYRDMSSNLHVPEQTVRVA